MVRRKATVTVLENRILPPVVAAVVAVSMWVMSGLSTTWVGDRRLSIGVALVFSTAGLVVVALAVFGLRRARKTISPRRPEQASSLVAAGVYRHTRNPMYLGFAAMLLALAAHLASPLTLLGSAAFALFIDRFQIGPEERALSARFGAEFQAERNRVRRWL